MKEDGSFLFLFFPSLRFFSFHTSPCDAPPAYSPLPLASRPRPQASLRKFQRKRSITLCGTNTRQNNLQKVSNESFNNNESDDKEKTNRKSDTQISHSDGTHRATSKNATVRLSHLVCVYEIYNTRCTRARAPPFRGSKRIFTCTVVMTIPTISCRTHESE